MTLRRFLLGWTLLCIAGWLALGGIAERQEAECRAADGFLCFDPGSAILVVGLLASGLWLVVALIVWGMSSIDARTVVVTVREGATVSKEGRVYGSGERLIVRREDEARLRQSNLIERGPTPQ